MDILYIQRFRNSSDRSSVVECACDVFGDAVARNVSMHSHPPIRLTEKVYWPTRESAFTVDTEHILHSQILYFGVAMVRWWFHAHLEEIHQSLEFGRMDCLPLCIP